MHLSAFSPVSSRAQSLVSPPRFRGQSFEEMWNDLFRVPTPEEERQLVIQTAEAQRQKELRISGILKKDYGGGVTGAAVLKTIVQAFNARFDNFKRRSAEEISQTEDEDVQGYLKAEQAERKTNFTISSETVFITFPNTSRLTLWQILDDLAHSDAVDYVRPPLGCIQLGRDEDIRPRLTEADIERLTTVLA